MNDFSSDVFSRISQVNTSNDPGQLGLKLEIRESSETENQARNIPTLRMLSSGSVRSSTASGSKSGEMGTSEDNYLQSILSSSSAADASSSQTIDHDPATCTCFACSRQRRREGLYNRSGAPTVKPTSSYLGTTNETEPISPLSPSGSTQSGYLSDKYPSSRQHRLNSDDSAFHSPYPGSASRWSAESEEEDMDSLLAPLRRLKDVMEQQPDIDFESIPGHIKQQADEQKRKRQKELEEEYLRNMPKRLNVLTPSFRKGMRHHQLTLFHTMKMKGKTERMNAYELAFIDCINAQSGFTYWAEKQKKKGIPKILEGMESKHHEISQTGTISRGLFSKFTRREGQRPRLDKDKSENSSLHDHLSKRNSSAKSLTDFIFEKRRNVSSEKLDARGSISSSGKVDGRLSQDSAGSVRSARSLSQPPQRDNSSPSADAASPQERKWATIGRSNSLVGNSLEMSEEKPRAGTVGRSNSLLRASSSSSAGSSETPHERPRAATVGRSNPYLRGKSPSSGSRSATSSKRSLTPDRQKPYHHIDAPLKPGSVRPDDHDSAEEEPAAVNSIYIPKTTSTESLQSSSEIRMPEDPITDVDIPPIITAITPASPVEIATSTEPSPFTAPPLPRSLTAEEMITSKMEKTSNLIRERRERAEIAIEAARSQSPVRRSDSPGPRSNSPAPILKSSYSRESLRGTLGKGTIPETIAKINSTDTPPPPKAPVPETTDKNAPAPSAPKETIISSRGSIAQTVAKINAGDVKDFKSAKGSLTDSGKNSPVGVPRMSIAEKVAKINAANASTTPEKVTRPIRSNSDLPLKSPLDTAPTSGTPPSSSSKKPSSNSSTNLPQDLQTAPASDTYLTSLLSKSSDSVTTPTVTQSPNSVTTSTVTQSPKSLVRSSTAPTPSSADPSSTQDDYLASLLAGSTSAVESSNPLISKYSSAGREPSPSRVSKYSSVSREVSPSPVSKYSSVGQEASPSPVSKYSSVGRETSPSPVSKHSSESRTSNSSNVTSQAQPKVTNSQPKSSTSQPKSSTSQPKSSTSQTSQPKSSTSQNSNTSSQPKSSPQPKATISQPRSNIAAQRRAAAGAQARAAANSSTPPSGKSTSTPSTKATPKYSANKLNVASRTDSGLNSTASRTDSGLNSIASRTDSGLKNSSRTKTDSRSKTDATSNIDAQKEKDERALDDLQDVLSHVDRETLRSYLNKANGDYMQAIGLCMEDVKAGII